jgi:DNA replicative helicase MCM subunit Mcm2 (Cdc46/Mcm family)
MSTFSRSGYVCDKCGIETPVLFKDWFLFGRAHFCCRCGHAFRGLLLKAGITHEFVCHQYAADSAGPGHIIIIIGEEQP